MEHTPTLHLDLVHNTDSRDIDAQAIGIHGAGLMSNGEARRIRIQHDGTYQDMLAASRIGDELISAVNSHAKLVRDNEELLRHIETLTEALTLARQALVNLRAEGESRYKPIVDQATEALQNTGADD